jgi:hypothetical protein
VKTAPSAFGTSPKYDDENFVCGFSLHFVGFGGGRWGLAKVNALRELRNSPLPVLPPNTDEHGICPFGMLREGKGIIE